MYCPCDQLPRVYPASCLLLRHTPVPILGQMVKTKDEDFVDKVGFEILGVLGEEI